MAVIQLDMLLANDSKNNQVGIRKLLNFILGNGNNIFYENNNIKKDIKKLCLECLDILDGENILINKLKNDRDKIFAHQDKKYLIDKTLEISSNYEDLVYGLEVVKKILTKISVLFNETEYLMDNFFADDIEEIEYIIKTYNKYEKEIQKFELNETIHKK